MTAAPEPDPARSMRLGRRVVLAVPFLWLLALFLTPFVIVARMSLSDTARALPPYAPHWDGFARLGDFLGALDLENYALLASDTLYLAAYLSSVRLAAISTILALVVAFPLAYAMARAPRRWQPALLVAVILPFWTSFLIRIYAWIGILRPEGFLDVVVQTLGLADAPLGLLNTDAAVILGMVYSYLPFMVLPIYAALERIDRSLLEAAADLGSPPWRSFWTVTVPLAAPGIVAGCLLVFIPAIGEFVIPDLLGGPDTLMIGKVLWTEFFSNRDWPLSSAVAIVLLAVLLLPVLVFQQALRRGEGAR